MQKIQPSINRHGRVIPPQLNLSIDMVNGKIDLFKSTLTLALFLAGFGTGYAKIHGSQHPEDYRLPFIISSDAVHIKKYQGQLFSVVALKEIIENLLQSDAS